MGKYETLLDVLDDYFQHIDEINNRRLEFSSLEANCLHDEFKVYHLLKRNVEILKSKERLKKLKFETPDEPWNTQK